MNITIVGGGGLGHVCAAVAASREEYKVSILSGHPSRWMHHVSATDNEAKVYEGDIDTISSKASDVVPNADVILFCVPGYLIERLLSEVKPYLGSHTVVGSIVSSTGFFSFAHSILSHKVPIFGFQRVPFISRVNEYGRSAFLLGYKKELAVAIENHSDSESLRKWLISMKHLSPTLIQYCIRADSIRCGMTGMAPLLTIRFFFTKSGMLHRRRRLLTWMRSLCR